MPSDDYIPSEDAQFRTYAENFSGALSSNPALYMCTPAQAASVQSVTDNFVAALAVSSNEATRTKATIIEKEDKRSICENLIRQYAMLI